MANKHVVKAVFDRKKAVESTGEGVVEIYIYLGNGEKKYIRYRICNGVEWRSFQKSRELQSEIFLYERLIEKMEKLGEPMTIETLNKHLGDSQSAAKRVKQQKQKIMNVHIIGFGFDTAKIVSTVWTAKDTKSAWPTGQAQRGMSFCPGQLQVCR